MYLKTEKKHDFFGTFRPGTLGGSFLGSKPGWPGHSRSIPLRGALPQKGKKGPHREQNSQFD